AATGRRNRAVRAEERLLVAQPERHSSPSGRQRSRSRARRGAAFAAAWQALRRPSRRAPAAWTRGMSAILALGLALAAAAHLLDEAAYGYARHSGSALVAAMARWTDIGESQWYLVPAGLLFIGIALLDWQSGTRRRQARLAFLFGQAGYAFAAVAVAGILNNILKLCIGRARPK